MVQIARQLVVVIAVVALAAAGVSCSGGHEQTQPEALATSFSATLTASVPATGTPSPNVCGSWSDQSIPGTAGYKIAAKYGEIRNCGLFGDEWIMNTLGVHDNQFVYTTSGVVAYYECEEGDEHCLDGRTGHPLSGWTVVEPPIPRGLTLMNWRRNKEELVLSGLTFSLITNTFVSAATPPR